MSSFKKVCEKYFGTSDFYEILKVEHDATEKQIKKAYHKLSLLVHPDRVDPDSKTEATEKFKVLGRIHSILQDEEKRRNYDDCGDISDDSDSDSSFNWMEYWKAIFKPIEIEDIDKHKQEYIGSEIELRDIKKAYVSSKGDMDLILEMVPFSNCDDEPRILEAIRKMIDDEEVEEYPRLFNESMRKKNRRRKKWDEEEKLAEQIDMKLLEQEMKKNAEKRVKGFADLISNIEAKYGGGGGSKRKSLTNGSPAKKRNTRSTKK